ncbi:type II secretion system protein [Vibrio renipiscarius]|uniref:type II secretion system protein n=1 Tax=Vibrio renipiscarius TaxID=1461322 RepID=UPI003552077E
MNKKKSSGFTLIELITVIVILAILAVVAFPRFMSYQKEAHFSTADSAFASFESAVNLYHDKWLTEGEPIGVVNYATGNIYPTSTGYPLTLRDNAGSNSPIDKLEGNDCLDLWRSLLTTDLTVAHHIDGKPVYNHNDDIVSWYTGDQCYYYYTKGADIGEELPILYYNPVSGEFTKKTERPFE